jgi:hypothetical protein
MPGVDSSGSPERNFDTYARLVGDIEVSIGGKAIDTSIIGWWSRVKHFRLSTPR